MLGSSKDQTGTFSGKKFSIDLTISLPKTEAQSLSGGITGISNAVRFVGKSSYFSEECIVIQ